jgi:tripartite-type tricarboxylate transporter receptor subunit TctC
MWEVHVKAKLVAIMLAVVLPDSIHAQDKTSDFAPKSLTMVIPSTPGGGTDSSGRLIAANIAKYLPGKPTVVIRNVPGANGTTAMNYFVRQAVPDGLTITMGSSSQADPVHYRMAQSHFDPTTFEIIGGAGRGGTVLIINKSAEARLYDRNAAPVAMGSLVGIPRSGMLTTAWGVEFLGWNVKWVVGYPGTNDLMIALERGEIDMTSTGNIAQIQKLLGTGKYKVLSQSGSLVNGRFEARADFAAAPLFHELVGSKVPDGLAREAFEYWANLTAIDKWVALPPKTPAPIVETYREAFIKAAADPELLEQGKRISDDFEPMTHSDVKKLLDGLGKTSRDAVSYINTMLRRQGLDVAEQKG